MNVTSCLYFCNTFVPKLRGRQATPMTTRDKAYVHYLKEHPNGNFIRFTQLSQAGKRAYGDPTAAPWPPPPPSVAPGVPTLLEPVARVGKVSAGPLHLSGGESARAAKELRRKIAWAVGSTYGVKYLNYDSWPAEYARRASERLLEIHGEP